MAIYDDYSDYKRYEDIVHYLTDGYWEWSGGSGRNFDVKPGDTLTVNFEALIDLSDEYWDYLDLAQLALASWSAISGIQFRETTSDNADILFSETGIQEAWAVSDTNANNIIIQSQVNVSSDWFYYEGVLGTLQTFIHEIGHALGLGHPGPYNGDYPHNFWVKTISFYESTQISVMSYIDQHENVLIRGEKAYVITPMIADINAIHELYGKPTHVNAGNTKYGYNGTAGEYIDSLFKEWISMPTPSDFPLSLTIYDTSGRDLLDLRPIVEDQFINLNPGTGSSIFGIENNLFIHPDTIIEHAFTGSGNDIIIGNDAANRLSGGPGDDGIFGGQGNDTIWGRNGADILRGDRGNDVIIGGDGDDWYVGGPGKDVFYMTRDGNDEDTIWDFNRGQDKINLQQFKTIRSVSDIDWYIHGAWNARIDLSEHGGGQIILMDYVKYGEEYIYNEDFIFADSGLIA